jgi:hypothetical protein
MKTSKQEITDLLMRDMFGGLPCIEAIAHERNIPFRIAAADHLLKKAIWRLGNAPTTEMLGEGVVFSDKIEHVGFAAVDLCMVVWRRLCSVDDVLAVEYGQTARYLRSLLRTHPPTLVALSA